MSHFLRGRNRFRTRGARTQTPAGIHHSKYINQAVMPEAEQPYQALHSFSDFGLDSRIVRNVQSHGYTVPTPIQDQAIPMLLSGRDVVGIANTGTGKTAAFLLPLIHKIVQHPKQGVLILAPTRELALQIQEEFIAFSRNLRLMVSLCIGGTSISNQIMQLRRDPHFVIGTPGRIKDLIMRGEFDTRLFTNIVLDEVDRMLDIGFRKDIQYLISQLPSVRQSAFFSATMNTETEEIMHSLLRDPARISVKKQETNLHIHQNIVKVQSHETKVDVLHGLLQRDEYKKVIVFGRTKHGINKLAKQLGLKGVRVSAIHGNIKQNARQRSLQAFKAGHVQALLATDIAARGIDIDDVTHVINYDEPNSYDDYIHRIGRTGRAGKVGNALTFVS